MKQLLIKSLLAVFIAHSTLSCGDDSGLSSQIEVNISPTNPQIFNSDQTANEGTSLEEEIAGPYFSFTLQIINNSESAVFLNPVTFNAFGFLGGTNVDAGTIEVGPEYFDRSDSPLVLAAGDKITSQFKIFFGGLPKADEGAVDNNFFRVVGEFEGFSGVDESTPEENITKQFQFTTNSN